MGISNSYRKMMYALKENIKNKILPSPISCQEKSDPVDPNDPEMMMQNPNDSIIKPMSSTNMQNSQMMYS